MPEAASGVQIPALAREHPSDGTAMRRHLVTDLGVGDCLGEQRLRTGRRDPVCQIDRGPRREIRSLGRLGIESRELDRRDQPGDPSDLSRDEAPDAETQTQLFQLARSRITRWSWRVGP